MLEILGMALTGAAVFAVLFWNRKKPEVVNRTQDLFRFKSLTKDGIIETPDGYYRLIIEVEPLNIALMSSVEQEATWTTFREMLSSLTVNFYFCVQSRHLDLRRYLDWLDERAGNMRAYPEINRYHERMSVFLQQENTERSIKDHRHYLILEVNPGDMTSNVQMQGEAFSALAQGLSKKKLTSAESADVAKQELENAALISQGFFSRMGIESYRLDHTAVLEACYAALNRDLAPVARFEDIHHKRMLSMRTHSLTPGLAMEVSHDQTLPETSQQQNTQNAPETSQEQEKRRAAAG